jgi:hypothetical protein
VAGGQGRGCTHPEGAAGASGLPDVGDALTALATALDAVAEAGRAAALDLHEGICDPGCSRWPSALRLRQAGTGIHVKGRCRATNLCSYCRTLATVETFEMLKLDALEYAPTGWVVLTAREHLTRPDCYDHLRQLRKAVRARWPRAEWFVEVEFQRRGALHLNLLVKGVPAAEAACEAWQRWDRQGRKGLAPPSCGSCLACVTAGVWCARVDAEPVGQWAGAIEDAGGVMRYLSKTLAHGLKAEQAPPLGWKGHRTSQTRGYFVRPASVMRCEARRSLQINRELWKLRGSGLDAAEAYTVAESAVDTFATRTWELVQVRSLAKPEYRPVEARPKETSAVEWLDGRRSVDRVTGELIEHTGWGSSPLDRYGDASDIACEALLLEHRASGVAPRLHEWRASGGLRGAEPAGDLRGPCLPLGDLDGPRDPIARRRNHGRERRLGGGPDGAVRGVTRSSGARAVGGGNPCKCARSPRTITCAVCFNPVQPRRDC